MMKSTIEPPSFSSSCGLDAVVSKNDGENLQPNENEAIVNFISSLELPDEVYALIAVFLPDAKSACRSAQVCRAFYKAVMKDELWTTLAAQKWQWSPLSYRVDCLDTATTVTVPTGRLENDTFKDIGGPISAAISSTHSCWTYSEFKRRHELDATVASIVQELSNWLAIPDALCSVLQAGLLDFGGQNENESSFDTPRFHWCRLTNLLLHAQNDDTTAQKAKVTPLQILDSLRPFLLERDIYGERVSTTEEHLAAMRQCLACQVADTMLFAHVYQEWKSALVPWAQGRLDWNELESLPSIHGANSGGTSTRSGPDLDHGFNKSALSHLCTGLNGIAQILLDDEQLMTLTAARCTVPEAIEAHLETMTAELRSTMEALRINVSGVSRHGPGIETVNVVVETLLTLMYETWKFTIDQDDSNEATHSSLFYVLESQQGTCLSLVVIAALILTRLEVNAYAVFVHDRVLLGVSTGCSVPESRSGIRPGVQATNALYFDFYHGARHAVTQAYCRRLLPPVTEWHDSFLQPVSTVTILKRMLLIIIQTCVRDRNENRWWYKVRTDKILVSVGLLLELIPSTDVERPNMAASHPELCNLKVGLTPLMLDPEIFFRHGLIDGNDFSRFLDDDDDDSDDAMDESDSAHDEGSDGEESRTY